MDMPQTRYYPRVDTGAIGSYVLNRSELTYFLRDLWTTDFSESFNNAFIGDASNALLGIRWYYGVRRQVPPGNSSYIRMGNTTFSDVGMVPTVGREFVVYDCGTVAVPWPYKPGTTGDYRNWTLVNYSMFIPFVGHVELNSNDVAQGYLNLRYVVNMTDGSAVAQVHNVELFNEGAFEERLVFSTSCSWGYDIPVRVDSQLNAVQRSVGIFSSMIPFIGGAIDSVNSNFTAGSYTSGSLTPNTGVMDDFTPRLFVTYSVDSTDLSTTGGEVHPSLYTAAVGNPSAAPGFLAGKEFVKIRNLISSAIVENNAPPPRHYDRIMELLREGVYVGTDV